MLNTFHIAIQGRPSTPAENGLIDVADEHKSLPLSITFETAYAQLEQLPSLFMEPDGALLWTGWDKSTSPPLELWRLDGCLYDSGPQLHYVELKGHCPSTTWTKLLAALAATEENAMVQQIRSGQFLSLSGFAERCLNDSPRREG